MDYGMIKIDGEWKEVVAINDCGYLIGLELSDNTEWYIAQDSTTAGEKAREYWVDMVENDPEEFICMVGEKTLVKWALNKYAGPGTTQVRNLNEWLDLWLDIPEEQWAGYDGSEWDCKISKTLRAEIEFNADCVCYRHN